jgi:two-component system alkaline phosphatase synthesis response regulator PhoP
MAIDEPVPPPKPARILVVDDEADFVELVSFNLREHGYEVITAGNGLDALFKARRFLPDLVVLDVMMEGVDGYTACEIIRCQPSTRDIPVVMVTAALGQLARLNGLAVGATDFFQKPVSMTALLQRVEAILKAESQRRAREFREAEAIERAEARWH